MPRRWCLLHGLGATGAVWQGVADALRARGDEVLCPDLAGHGDGPTLAEYTLEGLATIAAQQAIDWSATVVVGHSLGGYVALALADGRHVPVPRGAYTLGSKLSFSPEERARMAELAARPQRLFAERAEAVDRYRKVSGLLADIAADESTLMRGVRAQALEWRLSMDPRANAIVVPPIAGLLEAARCPIGAACGEHDPMVSFEDLHALVADATQLKGVGHNAHVEAPEAFIAVLDAFVARIGDS